MYILDNLVRHEDNFSFNQTAILILYSLFYLYVTILMTLVCEDKLRQYVISLHDDAIFNLMRLHMNFL